MVVVNHAQGLLSDDFRGKFGRVWGFGAGVFGVSQFGEGDERIGVYQRRRGKKGFIFVRCRDDYPTKSNSVGAIARRSLFRDGMLAWKALDTETKRAYNDLEYPPALNGCNRFMKKYLIENC